jgi:hypothetical protein
VLGLLGLNGAGKTASFAMPRWAHYKRLEATAFPALRFCAWWPELLRESRKTGWSRHAASCGCYPGCYDAQ